jgi:hypothetical protein
VSNLLAGQQYTPFPQWQGIHETGKVKKSNTVFTIFFSRQSYWYKAFLTPNSNKLDTKQGDQIGCTFAHWAIVFVWQNV